ncbi:hypothetical protein VTK56DRAFT_10289 [Thermocarpiscus australiensis]
MNAVVEVLGKSALKRLRKDKISTNSDNPYLERVPVIKNGQVVKYKMRERPLPDGLSPNDAKILRRVRKRAYRWDMGFRCCCFPTRVGWSAIFGLLPVIGDFADFFMALMIIKTASKIDTPLPKTLYSMMLFNAMVDLAIGFVPLLGDLADVFFRANTQNAWLLEAYLAEKAKAAREGTIEDPDSGKTVQVPPELRASPEDRDIEMGVEPAHAVAPVPVAPAAVVTPSRKAPAPVGNTAPSSRPGVSGRSLTGSQKTAGRQAQDPRDHRPGRRG